MTRSKTEVAKPVRRSWRLTRACLVALLASCGDSTTGPNGDSLAGQIVYTSDRTGEWRIHAMRPDGSARRTIEVPVEGYLANPSVSPDGSEIAFVQDGDIRIVRADGSASRRVTSGAAFDAWPVWSPDGSGIAFYSDRSGRGDIYFVAPDGSDLRQLTDSPEREYPGSWSADGRFLVFSREDTDARWLIAMVASDGSDRGIVPVPDGGFVPSLSPDGMQVVYLSPWDNALHIADVTGANDRLLPTDGSNPGHPQWSPDGAWIAFDAMLPSADGQVTSREVLVIRVDGTDQRRLTNDPASDLDARWGPLE